ncbi:efflux transporter outer membrane subunit [Thermodesulfobacteriota bacterium]
MTNRLSAPIRFPLLLGCLCFFIMNGCVKMGLDFRRPDSAVPVPDTYQHAQTSLATLDPEEEWWKAFGDPELNSFVEEVLENNLDIKTATSRILELRSRLIQTKADQLPSLNFQGQAQRQRRTTTITSPTFSGGSLNMETRSQPATIDSHSLSMPASYELDLWGSLAKSEEAARADILQAEENRRTVAQGVVSESINLYLQMESLERRIQITDNSLNNYRRSLALVESRYKRGLTTILAVRQARRTLVQAEADLPVLHQELGLIQQKLAVLLGRYPGTRPHRIQPEDYFKRLEPVPSGIPSELLMRRPDIRAAEAGLRALNARVSVAIASRFPRITLTGSFGYSSEDLSRLFKPSSELWNIAFGLVQPIFDAGKLKAGQRVAEVQYRQGITEYAKIILKAFSEVEGALLTRKRQIERRDKALGFLSEAMATQKVAENRYQKGLEDYLTVLEAQQTRFRAEENLVLIDLAILSNRVNLYRALGGNWAEPAPIKPDAEKNFKRIRDYLL